MPNYGIPFANGIGDAPAGEDNGAGGSGGMDWSSLGNGLGSLGMGVAGLFGMGGQNPSSAGMPYLSQIEGANQQYLNPWNQMGQNAGNNLEGVSNQIMQNPGQFMNQIGSNFHSSPGFNFAMQQAMMGGNQGAAAGGMAGSPQQSQYNQQLATQLGNQNYYNYTGQALGALGQGMQGEMGLAGLGENAGMGMANNISQMMADQAAMAYQGQNQQNQNNSSSWGDIASGIGKIFGL